MGRNCNLDLQLVTPSVSCRSDYVKTSESPNEKQLTVFYNGQIATCNATEIQARDIILLARREMEEKSKGYERHLPMLSSPGYNPTTGLSMKRSLQRFLQKRKIRAQETSPYQITNSKQ